MANLVSTETMEKLVAAGWTGPRPDAQEIADQLPTHFNTGDARGSFQIFMMKYGNEYSFGYAKPEGGKFINAQAHGPAKRYLWGECRGITMAEALANLWLLLREKGQTNE